MSVKLRKRDGVWWLFINHHGRRKAKKVGSREAAERAKRKIEARLVLGDFRILEDQKEPTFAEYADRWLKQHVEIACKPSTVASYRQILRVWVLPQFGNIRLRAITRNDVKEFISDLAGGGRYSKNTLRLILCTLRAILNHAIEDGLVDRNPCAKLGRFSKSEKPERQATALTREESERLLEAAKEFCPDYAPLFLAALRAGLRRGELVAIQWGDIQFGQSESDQNRHLLVQRNYVQGRFTTPKGKRSRRVDLSRQLRRELLALRDRRLLAAFQKGQTSIAEDLVFPSEAGTVLDPGNLVNRYFLPCMEKAGLRRIRFHDLRHTFGSQLIQSGAPLVYARDQMGHSSIRVTADIYAHLIPGANVGAIDKLDSETSPQPNATYTQPAGVQKEKEVAEVVEKLGAGERSRTSDLLITNQLLYQLSYAGIQIKMLTGRRNITPLLRVSIEENLFGERAAANPNP